MCSLLVARRRAIKPDEGTASPKFVPKGVDIAIGLTRLENHLQVNAHTALLGSCF
jgi:hypothetical protein